MPRSYREMEDILMRELHLYHHPIAVTFLSTEDEMNLFKEITPHVIPARPLTYCQWEIAARMQGQTVVGEKKQLGCHNARISFGWAGIDEDDIEAVAQEYASREVAELLVGSKPCLPLDSLRGIAVGPLGNAVMDPHVIHFYCDNFQSHRLAVEYMAATKTHPLRPMICESSSACGGGVFCWREQSFNVTPSCTGSYNSGKTERGEVNVFIPASRLEETVEFLEQRLRRMPENTFPGADICKNCSVIVFRKGFQKMDEGAAVPQNGGDS